MGGVWLAILGYYLTTLQLREELNKKSLLAGLWEKEMIRLRSDY